MEEETTSTPKKAGIGTKLLLLLFIMIGIVLLYFGVKGAMERHEQKQYYQTVKGVIQKVYVRRKKDRQDETYGAEYYYEVDGEGYTFRDPVYTSNYPQVGRTVSIHYDPDMPSQAYVEGKVGSFTVLLLLGVMFTCIPLVIFLATFVKMPKKAVDTITGFVVSFLFMVLGFGLLYALKPQDGMISVFLFIFGALGVYMFAGTIKNLFSRNSES